MQTYLSLFKEARGFSFGSEKPSLRNASIQADNWYRQAKRIPQQRPTPRPRVQPRQKTSLFDKNKSYNVQGIRNVYRNAKYPLYNTLEEFNANSKRNGIFVDNTGMIHAREVNPWTNATVTRQKHASAMLGKRFIADNK